MSSHPTPLQRLYQLVQLEREDITTLLIYGLGIGLMSLSTPIAVQSLVNTIAFGALFQPLLVLSLILLVLMAFSNILAAWQFYVVEMLQRRLFVRLFGTAATGLQQADFATRDSQYLPELSNRFFDVVTLQKTAAVMLLESLGYVLQTLIGMLLLAFYHPILLAFDLFLVAMLIVILFVMGKHGVSTAIEQSKAKYAAAAWLENIAGNALLGKAAHTQSFFRQRTDRLALDYLYACTQHFRILARQNIAALALHAVANTLLLGLGGWMVIERQLSLGQLIAAELVVNTMIYGLTRLGKILDNFYELLTSIDKIGHLLDLPQEQELGTSPAVKTSAYRVALNNVSLPQSPQLDTLRHLNLQIAPGERLVISSGAQRGSLLDLLFGLRSPASGSVSLDNQDLRDLNLGLLRDTIALVREPETLPGTIAENVHMGRPLDLHAIQQALQQVGLLEFITDLPMGLNTPLGLQGAPLSREQCLRLSLARALSQSPRLLMLDQVLDHIDSTYLPTLLDYLVADDSPWTLIVCSQQDRVIKACSRHCRIEQGAIVETSSPLEGL
ncbi:MAG: ABC transporter ATP-binding protein/permease [Methylomonas sp.]|jgi:ABC-type bacteriocin/lantibiotic exporter with double-glycine peptidase domain|uniref:peptidase domain-containing ABC transporter n=1 Tax=Methylomonas sp. TaxID=418 RepID=UPI0025D66852|nr:ABC transporter ATP-binding protein [Methylomonas sp.]MCK9606324.1 ABC transporter ATP-binding protein/permease [Methylomonas sp.]